jgi:hypothetical protein
MLMLTADLGDGEAFDTEAVRVMTTAFDRAWASVRASGAPFSASDYAERAREILGRYIIQAAKAGERDQRHLCDGALFELATANLKGARKQSKGFDARP